jgi:hypothetical protein
MKKIFSIILGFFYILLFVSCAPSSEQIANAVKATIDARPSEIPTAAIIITPTTSPTSTTVPIPSPTPDMRVVMEKPREFVLEKEDLPKAADYILPNDLWSSPRSNEEILQVRGIEKGNIYLAKTGRVTGWEQYFVRRNKGVGAEYPYELGSTVIQYKTAEGAKYTINEGASEDPTIKMIEVPSGGLADILETTFTGETNTFFEGREVDEIFLSVQHRNFLIQVDIMGFHDANQISKELAIDLAMKIVEKIDNAELFPNWLE